MKRFIIFMLAVFLLAGAVCVSASATETETEAPLDRGMCGEDIGWSFDEITGILTISGNGPMEDFPDGAPWEEFREKIVSVEMWGNIDYIGAHAFEDYDAIESVYLGDALRELGTRAFYGCDGLTLLELPSTFRCFGEESLRACISLKEIHCLGPMPSFRLNCLWDTWTIIYYPTNNPWPLEHIEQLEGAFQGRIEFLSEDGYDPYEPPAPTEETTEPTEEPTTEPTTGPTTETTEEPTTEPVTEPTTEPTTEATTEPTTAPTTEPATEPTTAPTAPAEPEKDEGPDSKIALAMIAVALSCFALGALVFGRKRQPKKGKGRYSR